MRIFLAFILLGSAACDMRKGPDEPDPKAVELSLVRTKVVEGLKDPSSAQFRNVRRVPLMEMSGKDPWDLPGHYCGEINAKNSFGAYIGFQKFTIRAPDSKGNFSGDASIDDTENPMSDFEYLISCEVEGKEKKGFPVTFPS